MKAVSRLSFISILVMSNLNAQLANQLYSYFLANHYQYVGDHNKAQQWYGYLLDNHAPTHIYKGYFPFLFDTNRFDTIVHAAALIDSTFGQEAEIQILLAQALEKTGNQEEAYDRMIKLHHQHRSNQTIGFQVANIYVQKKEPENALATIDNVLNSSPKKPTNFIFYFLKSQIYAQMNQQEKALENIQLCLAMQPQFDKGWLFMALLQEQAGRLAEAIQGFTTFLELTEGGNREVEQHLLQLIVKQKMVLSTQQKSSALQTPFMRALQAFEKKEYAQALTHVDEHLKSKAQDPEGRLLKIQILSAMNNHAQAAAQIKTWILEKADKDEWYKVLHLLCAQGLSYQKAIAILEDVAHAHPTLLLPCLYLADINTRAQHPDTALMYHQKAIALSKDKKLITKIYFQMGLLYYEQGKMNEMEAALEKGYALGLQFPPLLNLLAYHYIHENKKLDMAATLIQTALQANKNNPHFLDTQAYLLYRQGKLSDALTLLRTIIAQAPDDVSILQTLAKTEYQLGNTAAATDNLKQALTVAKRQCDKDTCSALLKEWTLAD